MNDSDGLQQQVTTQTGRFAVQCLVAALILGLTACAGSSPRILEVSSRQHTHTIAAEDEDLFVDDRASHIRVRPQPLPPDRQGQTFLVRWTPRTLERVTFEYRQVNSPNVISEQVYQVNDTRLAQFTIAGESYAAGGSVSAWRVTLYDQDQDPVATRQSTLW